MKKNHKKKVVIQKAIPKQSNPVYLKLEYDESVESKKGLLESEVSLLNIIKILQRYSLIRQEELQLKAKLSKAMKDLNLKLRQTKATFPFLEMPEEKHVEKIKKHIAMPSGSIPKEVFDRDLETELRSINEKLRALG